ncbi:ankyrin repeat domain-containing protein [Ferrimonas senticii]|uniref:ankyrin repeat domain-containing protein n=1 Tax=Ferrimonas senticii TaxID=394566 RepID=UPI0012EBC324|nr:ankyrin repeat domain-containing protein [Ferrimonas senticii]
MKEVYSEELKARLEYFFITATDSDGYRFKDSHIRRKLEFFSQAKDEWNNSLLHIICNNPEEGIDIDLLGQVLVSGCNPNSQNNEKNTPIHEICNGPYGAYGPGVVDAILMLVKHGACIELRNSSGESPLICATSYQRENYDEDGELIADKIVSQLLELGVGVNACDDKGITPLHIACAHNDDKLVEQLLSRGASPYSKALAEDACSIPVDAHYHKVVPPGASPLDIVSCVKVKSIFRKHFPTLFLWD